MSSISEKKFWIDLLRKVLNILIHGKENQEKTHIQHVVPHEDGWAVKGEGNSRSTAIYKYQKEAIDRARQIAKKYESHVIIHRKDGTIRERLNFDQ